VIITAGLDVGSTYTKAVIQAEDGEILGKAYGPTGFRLREVARSMYDEALEDAGLHEKDIDYLIATGSGRHQVDFKDLHVTDLTASARGACFLSAQVQSFRLNDKCAAGTGAFLEKTARYMGYSTQEIGALMTISKDPVPISGVCAVFAESEVINHLSIGTSPADIMQGAIESLTGRSVQLMKRVRAEPEYTLIGGILRFETMGRSVSEVLDAEVNVPDGEMVQYVSALGCAILARRRLDRLRSEGNLEAAVSA